LALIAQFLNFMTLCQGFVITGLETATSRLMSEYSTDALRRRSLLFTVGRIGLIVGLVTALVVALLSRPLAQWLLSDAGYAWVFVLGALGILATIANSVLLSVATARGAIGRVALSHMLATVAGLLIFAPAAIHWGIPGGLLASSLVFLASLLITCAIMWRTKLVHIREFFGRFDRHEGRRIADFYPMLIVHAVMVPLSLILIRQHVTSVLSLESAGLWQACWRLSDTYLMVVMMSVSLNFMVRLGRVVKVHEKLRAEVLKTLSASIGATAVMALGIFVLREWVVRIIFSDKFLPVVDYIPMQLVGDILRMVGWTLGFVLVATIRSRWYIAIEVAVPLVFISAAHVLASGMGVQGVTTAYVLAGCVHCVLSAIALRDVLRKGVASAAP
jgi:PST family polysaccharide transporter